MEIDDLTLTSIDAHAHLAISQDVLVAVAWHARRGFSDQTTYRFISAVVMTDSLRHSERWPDICRRIQKLRIDADIAALEVHGGTSGVID